MHGLDHFGFGSPNLDRALKFYDAALAPLGIVRMMDIPQEAGRVVGYGAEHAFFWVGTGAPLGDVLHIAFAATTRAQVDAFYAAAMAAGGTNNGTPGLRPQYHPNYYAAFIFDPDGHNVEAVCHVAQ